MGSSGARRLQSAFLIAFWLYFAVTGLIFLPYYNWQYAREHGFASWLFLGELAASAKALGWPYFAFAQTSKNLHGDTFHDWTALEKANSKHFLLSIQADLQSIQLSRDRANKDLSPSERSEILTLRETALREARLIAPATLHKIHPDLQRHLTTEYIPGLENRIRHLRSPAGDEQAERKGLALLDSWADWFNANRDDILIPK